jgi:Nicotinamide mononucleotide transporter
MPALYGAVTLNHLIPDLSPWNWALQAVALTTSYAGAELNARMRITGFYFWLVSNAALIAINVLAQQWILVLLYVLYIRVSISGACRWAREKPESAPKLAAWLARWDQRKEAR